MRRVQFNFSSSIFSHNKKNNVGVKAKPQNLPLSDYDMLLSNVIIK